MATKKVDFPMKNGGSFHSLPINIYHLGLSENVGYIPNEIAIFHRDNDQQNHWV